MFSSNQIFSISGSLRESESIIKVFELLESFGVKPDSYYFLDNGSLCFYQYCNEDKEGIIKIDAEDRYSGYYKAIISLYFASNRYKSAIRETFNDCSGLDGSSSEGWKISVSNDGFRKILLVEPYWCFYHK